MSTLRVKSYRLRESGVSMAKVCRAISDLRQVTDDLKIVMITKCRKKNKTSGICVALSIKLNERNAWLPHSTSILHFPRGLFHYLLSKHQFSLLYRSTTSAFVLQWQEVVFINTPKIVRYNLLTLLDKRSTIVVKIDFLNFNDVCSQIHQDLQGSRSMCRRDALINLGVNWILRVVWNIHVRTASYPFNRHSSKHS